MDEVKHSLLQQHCCKAMEHSETISISKRFLNGQERWMWERSQKDGKIAEDEITYCPYCGIDLNCCADPENRLLTLQELEKLAEADETVYEANGRRWKLYKNNSEGIRAKNENCDVVVNAYTIASGFFLYTHKPGLSARL